MGVCAQRQKDIKDERKRREYLFMVNRFSFEKVLENVVVQKQNPLRYGKGFKIMLKANIVAV